VPKTNSKKESISTTQLDQSNEDSCNKKKVAKQPSTKNPPTKIGKKSSRVSTVSRVSTSSDAQPKKSEDATEPHVSDEEVEEEEIIDERKWGVEDTNGLIDIIEEMQADFDVPCSKKSVLWKKVCK
jgi:hypothetical protein